MVDLIKEMRVAISNILLYPPESRLIKESISACCNDLSKLLTEDKILVISESEGKLLANGKPTETSGGIFLDSLAGCKIKSINFKPNFTEEELYNLLKGLSAKLKPESSPHIEISEKVYVPVGEKDLIIEIEKEGVELKEKIIGAAKEISKLIDSIEIPKEKDEVIIEVAKILELKHKKEEKTKKETKIETKEAISKIEMPPPELLTIEEAKKLLKVDSRFFLDEGMLQRVGTVLQSLRSPKELKLAGDLCDKLASNLEASVTDMRLKASMSFKRLYSTIETLRDKQIVHNIDEKIISAGRKETNGEVYKEIADILIISANRYLKDGNYEDTHAITGLLAEHAKSDKFKERQQQAKATINKLVGSEFTRLLVDDLLSPDKHRREKSFTILLDIGDPCIPHLISKIKDTPDFRLRKVIADLIVRIGDAAVSQLIQELRKETSSTAALRILDVFDGIGHEDLITDALKKQLSNPNFQLRRKAVEILYQTGTESAKKVLLEALDDESYIIRVRVIEFLGNMKYADAVPMLIKIIEKKGEKEDVQEKACRALGNIGEASAIPALFKTCSPKALFYTGKSREIRIAALESLVKLGDDRVKKFIDDKDPFVSKIAKELFGKES